MKGTRRKLLDILACPIDKHHPLELYELTSESDKIIEGALACVECARYYPIIDEIPIMLPDDLRKENEELEFLKRWADKLPQKIVFDGKPFRLQRPSA